jgi:hypothetical protein
MRDDTSTRSTLQVFTVMVAGLEGLQLPLHVFGMVAMRDKLDYRRNIIFSRKGQLPNPHGAGYFASSLLCCMMQSFC